MFLVIGSKSHSAKQGFADAQYLFARNLRHGWGMNKDVSDAIEWFKKAANQGHTASMTELSSIYEKGEGVPVDNAEVLYWLQAASDLGSAAGQYQLANYYDRGAGDIDESTKAKALELYRKSAGQNYSGALSMLGVIYEYGANGVDKDLEKALDYYKSAVVHGSTFGALEVGEMLEQTQELYNPEAAAGCYFDHLAAGYSILLTRSAKDWDKETARELQILLEIGGFYNGPLDGDMGTGSKKAMKLLCKCE